MNRVNGNENLFWFGIVEDINDPDKLGRVKVRNILEEVLDKNSKDFTSTENLPWATVLMPPTGAAAHGLGNSPTGLKLGSKVICFCMDYPEKNLRYIIGALNNVDADTPESHTVSKVAKGEWTDSGEKIGPEPKSSYLAKYPYNSTITTESGHVIEIDDTPKAERINIKHRSGSYIEMRPDGSVVTKSNDISMDITKNRKIIYTDNGQIDILSNSNKITISGEDIVTVQSDTEIQLCAPLISFGCEDREANVLIRGNLEVTRDSWVHQKSLTNGNIIGNSDLHIDNNTNIGGKTDIGGDTNIAKDINVVGKSLFRKNVNIGGDTVMIGDTRIQKNLVVDREAIANNVFLSVHQHYDIVNNQIVVTGLPTPNGHIVTLAATTGMPFISSATTSYSPIFSNTINGSEE